MPAESVNFFEINNLEKIENLTTELFNAIAYKKPEEVKQLILEGANVNAVNKDGYTPLHSAFLPYGKSLTRNNIDIAKILIDAGADVNAANVSGRERVISVLNLALNPHLSRDSYEIEAEATKLISRYVLLKNPAAEKLELLKNYDQIGWINLRNYLSACSAYWDNCKIEISSLKKITFGEISLFDFLAIKDIDSIENLNKLARMSDNKNLKAIINEPSFIERYPVFGSQIKERFEQGLARNKHLTTALNSLFHNNKNAKLNEDCSLEVLKYLDKESLKSVTQVASIFFRPTPSDNKRSDIAQTNDFLLKP